MKCLRCGLDFNRHAHRPGVAELCVNCFDTIFFGLIVEEFILLYSNIEGNISDIDPKLLKYKLVSEEGFDWLILTERNCILYKWGIELGVTLPDNAFVYPICQRLSDESVLSWLDRTTASIDINLMRRVCTADRMRNL